MKRKSILWGLASISLIAIVAPGALAADKEKPSAEVEARVSQVLQAKYPDVVIKGMGKETEDGLSFVGVEMTSKGTKMEVDVMEDGTLVGSEEEADVKTFPKPAAKALKKATKGMTVKATEIAKTYAKADPNDKTGTKAVTLAEPTVAYEMDVEKDGHKGEFAVDAEGKILESPKWANGASTAKKEKDDKD